MIEQPSAIEHEQPQELGADIIDMFDLNQTHWESSGLGNPNVPSLWSIKLKAYSWKLHIRGMLSCRVYAGSSMAGAQRRIRKGKGKSKGHSKGQSECQDKGKSKSERKGVESDRSRGAQASSSNSTPWFSAFVDVRKGHQCEHNARGHKGKGRPQTLVSLKGGSYPQTFAALPQARRAKGGHKGKESSDNPFDPAVDPGVP